MTLSPRRDWLAVLLAVLSGLALAWLPLTESLLILAGAAVVLVALVRPQVSLYLLPFTVPFGGIREVTLGGLRVTAAEVLVGLLVVAWLARGVAQRGIYLYGRLPSGGDATTPAPRHHPRFPPLLWPLLLLLGTMALSLLDAFSYAASAKELFKWLEVLAVYLVAASLLSTGASEAGMALPGSRPRPIAPAVWLVVALLAAGALEALAGLLGSVLRMGPPSYAILGGLIYRASGDFGQPNPFAGYMNQVWPLALALLATGALLPAPHLSLPAPRPTSSASSLAPHAWRVALLVALCLPLAALVLSWSRGAWLGAVAAVAVMLLVWTASLLASRETSNRRQGRRALGALLVGAVLLAAVGTLGAADLLPPAVVERLGSITEGLEVLGDVRTVKVTDANFASVERAAHWWAGWRMWEEHPWTGVGIGNYAVAYPLYNLPAWPDPLGHAHNLYINMGAEAGTVGLAAYLIFLVAALWQATRSAWRATDAWQRGLALGVLGILVARMVQDGLDNLWVHGMGVQVALLLALLTAPPVSGMLSRHFDP